jgi:hypothetical protein
MMQMIPNRNDGTRGNVGQGIYEVAQKVVSAESCVYQEHLAAEHKLRRLCGEATHVPGGCLGLLCPYKAMCIGVRSNILFSCSIASVGTKTVKVIAIVYIVWTRTHGLLRIVYHSEASASSYLASNIGSATCTLVLGAAGGRPTIVASLQKSRIAWKSWARSA